jgi:hypothetical protein
MLVFMIPYKHTLNSFQHDCKRKLRFARNFFLPLLCAVAASAQPADDPGGWNNLKWGVTLAGVRALYPSAVEDRDAYWIHLALPPVTIGGISLGVTASAPKGSDKITMISLDCLFGVPPSPRWQLCAGPADFETLKPLLLQKYGRQKNEERKAFYSDLAHLFLWVFPTTSIQLRLDQAQSAPSVGGIGITYRPLDPGAADLL